MVAQPRAHRDRLTSQATRPKRRIACLAGIVFAMMVGTCGTGLVVAQAPEPSWEGRMTARYVPGLPPLKVDLELSARDPGERKIAYTLSVTNYFLQTVGEVQEGVVTMPGEGELGRQPLVMPVPGDGDQYRLKVRLKEVGAEREQEFVRCLLTDVTAGYRRELRLESGDWQYLPVKDGAALMPQSEEWKPGRGFGGQQWSQHFEEDTAAVWFRTEFGVPQWLAAEHYEVYFADVRFGGRIFLNGKYLGQHIGPYYPFSFDATSAVLPGQVNSLAVCVWDTSVGTTPGYVSTEGRFVGRSLWPIPAAGYDGMGVFGEVRLRGKPAVHISDVFALPHVSKGQLGLRVTVRNTSSRPQEVVIKPQVEDTQGVALHMSPRKVSLLPGEERQVEMTQEWADPRLWWPHDPHLYRLRSTLVAPDGATLDEFSVRFGYREFKVAGRFFDFNGRRFKTSLHPWPWRADTYEEAWQSFTERVRAAEKAGHRGPYFCRFHLKPPTPAMLDAADELGIVLENEGSLGSIVSNLEDPRTWENYKQMLTDFFHRDKNHPSLIMWSAENEILICTNCYPDLYEWNQKHLLELGRYMQVLDPTRPLEFNGDADIDGTWPVMNLHYPRDWYKWPELPNSAFWLHYGAEDLTCDQSYPLRVTWNQPKPIVFGEDGLYVIRSVQPHDMSSLGGEETYRLVDEHGYWGAGPIADQAQAMFTEGYRHAEVSIYTVAYGGTGGPACDRALLPVRFFIRERDKRFYSGETVPRHVNIHNDTLQSAQMEFAWRLANNGRLIAQGKSGSVMHPGEVRRLVVDLPMPVVDEVTPIQFDALLGRNGQRVFSEIYEYTVYPQRPLQADPDLKLGVLDRAGDTIRALSASGLTFVPFGTIEPGTDALLSGLNCLLIGENGFDTARMSEFHKSVTPFVEGGGTLIVLRHDDTRLFQEDWMPVPALHAATSRNTTISWSRCPAHPVLRGLDAETLRYWRGDHVVSTGDFVKAPAAGWRPLVDAGGMGGLRWTSLVEMPVGRGTVLVCQMHLVKKLNTEPAAHIVLQNLLNYAATRTPRTQLAAVSVVPPAGRLAKRLRALRFTVRPGTTESVIVVDAAQVADQGEGDALTAELQARLAEGSTVVLHGLTPDCLGQWQGLLPPGTTLREVNSMHAVSSTQHELLAGISATELWWSDVGRESEDGEVEVAYSADAEGAIELVAPGALLALPTGQGLLVVDQLLWAKEGVNQSRSGLYAALLIENLLAHNAARSQN